MPTLAKVDKKKYHSFLYHYKATKDIEAARAIDWPSIQDCDYLVSKSLDAQLQTASQPSKTGLFDTFHNKTTDLRSNSLTVSLSLITSMIFFFAGFPASFHFRLQPVQN